AQANGRPTMVMARRMAQTRCPSASHQPASTSQMMLPITPSGPVPTSSWPVWAARGTALWPNGNSVYCAMLNAARAQGMPTMVITMMTAAITHATAISRPPKTIQRMLSNSDNGDIGVGFPAGATVQLAAAAIGTNAHYVDSDAAVRQIATSANPLAGRRA